MLSAVLFMSERPTSRSQAKAGPEAGPRTFHHTSPELVGDDADPTTPLITGSSNNHSNHGSEIEHVSRDPTTQELSCQVPRSMDNPMRACTGSV